MLAVQTSAGQCDLSGPDDLMELSEQKKPVVARLNVLYEFVLCVFKLLVFLDLIHAIFVNSPLA